MTAAVEFEYLGTPERPRRRGPLIAAAVVVVIAVLVGGFLWWSDQVRTRATDDLSQVFASAAQRAASGERQVQGTLAYASPMIWSAEVGEDVRADLRALVEASAADVAADLGALREQVATTTVLPWHQEQLRARTELLTLIDAQQARFAGIARDASDIDLVLAGGPLPTGAVSSALRDAGAR